VAVPVRIRIKDIDQFIEQNSANLSTGGIYIPMRVPFPAGTVLDLEVHFAQSPRTVKVKGKVVRSIPQKRALSKPPGVAVEFVELDEVARRFIGEAVETFNRRHPSEKLDLPEGFLEEVDRELEARIR
jgi:uncharacterized protein (TIGR02266 family)